MNIFLTLAIFVANVVAITLIYQFVKKQEKREQLLFIAVSVGVVYILVSIIYAISGIGIDKSINESAKNFTIYLFVPINVILLVPFIATKYIKYRNNKISKRDFLERVIKVCFVGIILLGLECGYMRHIKQNIKGLNLNIEQTKQQNETSTNYTNTVTNQITNETINELTNKTITNSEILTTNTIVNEL